MNQHAYLEAVVGKYAVDASIPRETSEQSAMPVEPLPFTVKIVRSAAELDKAVHIRHAAYARHIPELAARLSTSEAYDWDEGAVVLLAESKLDGSPLGTMRIQTNRYGKLALEQSVELPDWLQGRALAEVTRFGVSEGRAGRLVNITLVKAAFQYCLLKGIEWVVIAARSPLDRQYAALLFEDVFPDLGFVAMRHAGNIAHRVLGFQVATGHARWTAASHPMLGFMCNTRHPDIRLGEGDSSLVAAAALLSDPFRQSGLNPLMCEP